jgi:hypothetical protein
MFIVRVGVEGKGFDFTDDIISLVKKDFHFLKGHAGYAPFKQYSEHSHTVSRLPNH